jgi:sarcosine oxidase subunit beta
MVIDFETTFYFHREGAGILFGMSDPSETTSFNTTVSWEFLERVIPVAVKRLPFLTTAAIAHAWAGLYEITPDAMPIIGEASELSGFFNLAGFSGHGFQHSPAAGRMVADMVACGGAVDSDASPFELNRFKLTDRLPESNVV